jgi:predicted permease
MRLLDDIRIFVRAWPRMPLLVWTAVGVLALGIGAAAVAFNFVDAILLQRSPIHDLDRLVSVWTRQAGRETQFIESSYPQYLDWREQGKTVFEAVTTMASINFAYRLVRQGEPVRVYGRSVSDSFFDTLGATPLLGRTFRPADNEAGTKEPVLVMSWGLWQRQFAGDPRTIGSAIRLNDRTFTVIGIMPRDFQYPAGAEVWTPVVPEHPKLAVDRGVGWLQTVARLRTGVTASRAREEATAIARRGLPPGPVAIDALLVPLPSEIFGASRPALVALMGAAVLLLLIACANVGHLLLVRSATRRRELAVRRALGASRGRLARQQFAEALTLAVAGGAAGIIFAAWTAKALVPFVPIEIPGLHRVGMNARTMAFACAVTLVTAAIISVVPAAFASVRALADALKLAGADAADTRGSGRVRRLLMLSQVALAIVVLVSTGLLVRSFLAIRDVDLGFKAAGVLKIDVDLDRAGYDELLARVRQLPGVAAAGAIYLAPLELGTIGMDAPFIVEGQSRTDGSSDRNPPLNWEAATPGYFETMRLPLLQGRLFTDRDTAKSPAVVIVSEGLARVLSPDGRAVGRKLITLDGPKDAAGQPVWQTVVGVVKDARYRELTRSRLDIYLPHTQADASIRSLVVRATEGDARVRAGVGLGATTGAGEGGGVRTGAGAGVAVEADAGAGEDPLALVAPIREIARAIDPAKGIDGIVLLEDVVARARASWTFNALVFSVFGALSLVLVAAGLFGVLAYGVATRTREIGIRLALGAQRRNVLRTMLSEGLIVTAAGLAAGLTIAWTGAHVLDSLLFGIAPRDPATFAAATALVCLVTLAASWIPARAAMAVSPLVALRRD